MIRFIQTKPPSPGSECQKHAARGRNRVQTCTEARRSQLSESTNISLWVPRSNFITHRITSQTWNRGRKTLDESVFVVVMTNMKRVMMAPDSRKRAWEGRGLSGAEPSQGPPPRTYGSLRLAPTTNTTNNNMLRSPPPPSAHRCSSAAPLLQVCPGWSRCVAVVRLLYIPNGGNPERNRSTLH